MIQTKLGIIAGSGKLPLEISEIYRQLGGECFVVRLYDKNDLNNNDHHKNQFFNIGAVNKIIDYLKKNQVENIVFAGSIKRPNLSGLKLDLRGSILLASIMKNKFLGDDKLLTSIVKFIEQKGFKVISPLDIIGLTTENFPSNNCKITKQDKIDIKIGMDVAHAIGSLDIGQSVIVENGYILGVEAAEGTDNLIKRCAALRKNKKGGVLVKTIKPNQDRRIDIPTIGPATIELLYEYYYNGIAISKKEVIIVQSELTFELANKYNLFINVT